MVCDWSSWEIGQQTVTEKGLGDGEHLGGKGPALLLTKTQALLGLFEKYFNGPAAQILLHHGSGGQGEIGAEKGGLRRLRLDLATRSGFQVRLFIPFGQDHGAWQAVAAGYRHGEEGES